MSKVNRFAKTIGMIKSKVPGSFHSSALSLAFNTQVKYAGLSGIKIEKLTETESKVTLKNRMRVQNHIGGVHACGMALLAESATGMVFAMNVRDDCIPLMKSMKIDFKRIAKGDLKATASLSKDMLEDIHSKEKGEVTVPVVVTDSDEKEPISASMTWAWVKKSKV
uniref:DUF4442 domain-containing protein n=1 Tax=Hemiselmis andersenii TaxID=464988 RepID=A0A6U4P834_HEMAN|mmetsp:Transcript_7086/g.16223  ORF Transcript_7086/g.16223 Transcript_7086/m.16223 type:complete len:166 (-) Transcript_7086:80-577(-)